MSILRGIKSKIIHKKINYIELDDVVSQSMKKEYYYECAPLLICEMMMEIDRIKKDTYVHEVAADPKMHVHEVAADPKMHVHEVAADPKMHVHEVADPKMHVHEVVADPKMHVYEVTTNLKKNNNLDIDINKVMEIKTLDVLEKIEDGKKSYIFTENHVLDDVIIGNKIKCDEEIKISIIKIKDRFMNMIIRTSQRGCSWTSVARDMILDFRSKF